MDAAQMFEEFKLLQKNVAALMLAQEDNVKTLQREEDIKTAMLDEMESQEQVIANKDEEIAVLRRQLEEKENHSRWLNRW